MLARLTLRDFRNHEDALIVPRARFVLLTGENGAGKTNILEAISLLTPGRGLRGATLSQMARQGGPGGFGLAAQVDGVTIGTGADAETPDRRQVRIGGVAHAASALADYLSVIWLTPAMDRLFMDSAGDRRRFLDRLTLALLPSHAVHSTRYEAAMRARNKLLAERERAWDEAWLGALEAQMAEHGAAIHTARAGLVARLGDALAAQSEGPFARPALALSEWEGAEKPLEQALCEGRRRDAAAGRTLAGPHRSDLQVMHQAKGQAAALCSTGEQKALLLSILLAHAALVGAERGQAPVLLLDEVAAHLDPARRLALFARLEATGSQIWMTGTEAALFEGIMEATRLRVAEGRVWEG
ncbi:MAG: DNA replication/repair protein RecF [Sphingobium sp.]|nr:DNA replication/repair protein RecF [Sphingobium sp.]MCI1270351.1 DNA replication/repair protein RecF [Sphingobium sp.]MCI1755498.1 DNA replication/repair protein RecF [Sphingobium sp.]MCI2052124.1 DNA replication/repair protein RecF [Sphingobium sp.]